MVVGSGIEAVAHVTQAAKGAIEQADEVLYLVGDWVTADWIVSLNPAAESLRPLYRSGQDRRTTYRGMVERTLRGVRAGRKVCAVFYGHPGVFADAPHEAIRVARQEGYAADMLAGVSAEDCLFADLGVDPGRSGCQSYEATHFLLYRHRFDVNTPLVLWQVGVVGHTEYQSREYSLEGFQILAGRLAELYGPDHEAILYAASIFGVCKPDIQRVALGKLAETRPTATSTLYVPAKDTPPVDDAMVQLLGGGSDP